MQECEDGGDTEADAAPNACRVSNCVFKSLMLTSSSTTDVGLDIVMYLKLIKMRFPLQKQTLNMKEKVLGS